MKLMHNYYVYILRCSDDSYYTGVTNDLDRRISEHNCGEIKGCYTSSRLPVELMYCERFHNIRNAIAFEKQIKSWSRKKKEALFREDWTKIIELSKSGNKQPPGSLQ